MAVHQALTQIEILVDKNLDALSGYVHDLIHGTVFEYWFLNQHGQTQALFLALLSIAFSWLLFLQLFGVSGWLRKSSVKLKTDKPAEDGPKEPDHPYLSDVLTGLPVLRTLQPHSTANTHLGHRRFPFPHSPSNADVSLSSSSIHDLPSSPDFDSPYTDATNKRDFSFLKNVAPDSYATLQQTGMLNPDGTPTKKMLGTKQWSPKPAVQVGYSTVMGYGSERKNGLQALRQELVDEEDAKFVPLS